MRLGEREWGGEKRELEKNEEKRGWMWLESALKKVKCAVDNVLVCVNQWKKIHYFLETCNTLSKSMRLWKYKGPIRIEHLSYICLKNNSGRSVLMGFIYLHSTSDPLQMGLLVFKTLLIEFSFRANHFNLDKVG